MSVCYSWHKVKLIQDSQAQFQREADVYSNNYFESLNRLNMF